MTIGERIKQLRTQLNYSQVQFADMINVSKQTLYKYENNIITNIPSDKIELVAKYCNTTPGYIMGWDDTNISLSDQEKELITKYRQADDVDREMVHRILHIQESIKKKDLA